VTIPPLGWNDINQRMWDERVPIHTASDYYDVAGFKAGKAQLEPFEVEELGAMGGCRLVHLQCHFGLDTLDLVRMHPTLTAAGLDFSTPAVAEATRLAAEVGLDDRATFVHGDVYEAAERLGIEAFDVVYTGKGALCWLPDLRDWAEQCARLLKPGGWLYLCEFHEVGYCLAQDEPAVVNDYFFPGPLVEEAKGTYADLDASTTHNLSYQWPHPTAQVLNAVIGAGLQLRFFHEWDHTLFKLNNWLVEEDDHRYRWPGPGRLPLMYSLKAEKPASSPPPGPPNPVRP
jgi:SAM-dependent methyltransferase